MHDQPLRHARTCITWPPLFPPAWRLHWSRSKHPLPRGRWMRCVRWSFLQLHFNSRPRNPAAAQRQSIDLQYNVTPVLLKAGSVHDLAVPCKPRLCKGSSPKHHVSNCAAARDVMFYSACTHMCKWTGISVQQHNAQTPMLGGCLVCCGMCAGVQAMTGPGG